jgi:hypothetical protein
MVNPLLHSCGALVLAFSFAATCGAQSPVPGDSEESHSAPAVEVMPVIPIQPIVPDKGGRIMGVIPDFQTVRNSNGVVAPLTAKQKWNLAFRESMDPFNIATAAMAAGFSQRENETPKYGEGGAAYGKRFGAAVADVSLQNLFSAGLLATVLHQDPRYYRKGPGTGVIRRAVYSVSRIVIARQDTGQAAFNASGVGGTLLGIAASNMYYPSASRCGTVMLGRLTTSFTGGVMGNLMSEFWPDIQKKFFHRRHAAKS